MLDQNHRLLKISNSTVGLIDNDKRFFDVYILIMIHVIMSQIIMIH